VYNVHVKQLIATGNLAIMGACTVVENANMG